MISIRPGQVQDLIGIQNCNIQCLPENYTFKYYYYHYLCWPDLIFVAEDTQNKKIVGYVLAKVDDEDESELKQKKGHITSLSVLRDYRRLGIARQLMEATHVAMKSIFDLNIVTLHVRETNQGALGLYRDTLKYQVLKIDKEYYADKEDAYLMQKNLDQVFPKSVELD